MYRIQQITRSKSLKLKFFTGNRADLTTRGESRQTRLNTAASYEKTTVDEVCGILVLYLQLYCRMLATDLKHFICA